MAKYKIFLTIASTAQGEFEEKKSRFMAYAYPVRSEEEIKTVLSALKDEHPKARHHCYAYRLGASKDIWKASDAGEPSNSAGMPILGQIRSFDLTNVLVVVVRYYGGVKLGVGGLMEAYKLAARAALEQAKVIEDYPKRQLKIKTSYVQVDRVLNFLRQSDVGIESQDFGAECALKITVPEEEAVIFAQRLAAFPETEVSL